MTNQYKGVYNIVADEGVYCCFLCVAVVAVTVVLIQKEDWCC